MKEGKNERNERMNKRNEEWTKEMKDQMKGTKTKGGINKRIKGCCAGCMGGGCQKVVSIEWCRFSNRLWTDAGMQWPKLFT